MHFARDAFDVGLFTNRRDAQLAFWQKTVGLPFDHIAKLGGGLQQHRHGIGDAVLKLNHAREPLPAMPAAGYSGMTIALPGLPAARELQDPDGNRVSLLPAPAGTGPRLTLQVRVNAPAAHGRFLTEVLSFERVSDCVFARGSARLELSQAEEPVQPSPDWRGPGIRYLTLQVLDARRAFAAALAAGAAEGNALRDMGERVRFAFIRDPDGNWIELSERTDFTGRPLCSV